MARRQAPQQLSEKQKLAKERDLEKVRGTFRFHEVPGGEVTFPFSKYQDVPSVTYKMIDVHAYEVPRMVAVHINNNTSYPIHAHAQDENGMPSKVIGQRKKRMSFESLDFADVGEDFSINTAIYNKMTGR